MSPRRVRPLALAVAVGIARLLEAPAAMADPDAGCPEAGAATTGTALYFGNGITTTYDQALEVADDDLQGLAADAKIGDVVELGVAYNHTDAFSAAVIQALGQEQARESAFRWFFLNSVTSDLLQGLNALDVPQLPADAPAFVSALQATITSGIEDSDRQPPAAYAGDVADQVSGYDADLRAGRRVIVLAHSQANLYASAALASLATSEPSLVASFGFGGVADPAETTFEGYVTSDGDAVINALRAADGAVVPANVHVPASADFTGHLFEATYANPLLPARTSVVTLLAGLGSSLPYPTSATTGCGPTCTFGAGGSSALIGGSVVHGQTQSYSLPGVAGAGIFVRAVDVAHTAFVPGFDVYDPTGARVVNLAFGGDVASAEFTASMTGTYTVSVYDSSYDPNVFGAYALYWTVAPASACGVLTPGAAVTGSLAEGALDSYTFTAQTGQGVMLRATDVNGGALVPTLNVYDANGAPIFTDSAGQDVAGIAFTAPNSGTYTVVVFDTSGPGVDTATGPYDLYYVRAPGANKGGALSPGTEVTGQLAEGALDSYTFDAQAGQGVMLRAIDVNAGPMMPAFNVYDPTGKTLFMDTSGQDVAGIDFAAPASGTYTVVFYDSSGTGSVPGPYELEFFLAPGADTRGAISPGADVKGQLAEGALDSYTFTAQAGQGVMLRATDVSGGPLVPTLDVYDPTGHPIFINSSGQDVASLAFDAPATGTYTVVVYDSSGPNSDAATGPYDLHFFLANATDNGGTLGPGAGASGHLAEGAVDSYTFTAQAAEGVILRLTDVDAGPMVPTLNVYDPSGAILFSGASGQDVASLAFAAPVSGTYTVAVYDSSGSGGAGSSAAGPYNLYFFVAPGADKGGVLASGGAASATLAEGAIDSYAFVASLNATVTVTVQAAGAGATSDGGAGGPGEGGAGDGGDGGAGGLTPTFNVYDPTGAIVVNGASGQSVASGSFTALTAGTFTIAVYDGSPGGAGTGSYSVSLTMTP